MHPRSTSTAGWPQRVNLVILFFSSNLICYMDRINISVTAPMIMKELGWDEAALGIILSSFFVGYTLLQIPGGWLADRFGGKLVLSCGVLWWSLFTLITPIARSSHRHGGFQSPHGPGGRRQFPLRPEPDRTLGPRRGAVDG